MLIAIAGSQGTGKTTLIHALENAGYLTVQRKTSRSIMSEWNVTLEQVNNDHDLTVKFQDEILNRKLQDEHHAALSRDIWITERTFADLFTYALISLGKENKYSQWIDQYYEQCKQAQLRYSGVVYLTSGQFEIQHDGIRGSNQHYGKMVDMIMKDVTTNITYCGITEIDNPHLQFRVDKVQHLAERVLSK